MLQILNANGQVVSTLTDSKLLDGPWDLTIDDDGKHARVFVSNVLSGTVTRIDLSVPHNGNPQVVSETQIASGYTHGFDMNALVIGPTGLAFDEHTDTLYVASTGDNEIFAVHNAETTTHDKGMGTLFVQDAAHLHGPLGLVLAPNGDLIAANGDAVKAGGTPNDLVEYNHEGQFVGDFQVDTGAAGAAFGVTLAKDNGKIQFVTVNDNTNSVEVFTLTFGEGHHKHHHESDGDGDGDDK